MGKLLVRDFMTRKFPIAQATGWSQVLGAMSLAFREMHRKDDEPKNSLVLAILDFNVPNARDAIKQKEIASAIATIFKSFWPERCVLLAHMAAYSKDDTDEDP